MTLSTVPEVELLPARTDTDSWVTVVREITLLAQQIAGTSFVPKGLRDSIPATAAAMLYGREIGLPPMTALSQIHVVDGRPSLSAEAMRALVLAAGHAIEFDETTGAVCRIRGRRARSTEWTRVDWTIDDARKAGLLRRGSAWEGYPRDMLVARATTALCRMVFPDVIHGFRSAEELDDMVASEGTAGTSHTASSSTGKTTRVSRAKRAELAPPPPAGPREGVGSSPEGPAPAPARPEPSLPGESGSPVDPAYPAAGTVPPGGPDYPVDVPRIGPRHASTDDELPLDDAAPPKPEPNPDVDLVNRVTLKLVFAQLRRLGVGDDAVGRRERLAVLSRLAGREIATANELTQAEGSSAILVLSACRDAKQLDEVLTELTAAQVGATIETTEAKPEGEGSS